MSLNQWYTYNIQYFFIFVNAFFAKQLFFSVTVSSRENARIASEGATEIGLIFKAACPTDLTDAHTSFRQQKLCLFAACQIDVGNKGVARDAAEFTRKIIFAQTDGIGYVIKGKISFALCADQADRLLDAGEQIRVVLRVRALEGMVATK